MHVYRVGFDAKDKWTPVSWRGKDNAKEDAEEWVAFRGTWFTYDCLERRGHLFEGGGEIDKV